MLEHRTSWRMGGIEEELRGIYTLDEDHELWNWNLVHQAAAGQAGTDQLEEVAYQKAKVQSSSRLAESYAVE